MVWLRRLLELLASTHTLSSDSCGPGVRVKMINNVHVAYRDLAAYPKARKRTRPEPIIARRWLCVHQTGVEFGVSTRQVNKWLKRYKSVGPANQPPKAWAERMALFARFWPIPYHFVYLPTHRVLLQNQPLNWYTYHGNGANPGLGFAIVADLPEFEADRKPRHTVLFDGDVVAAQRALRLAWDFARASGCPLQDIRAHRQYSPRRRPDPGERVWRNVVEPMARRYGIHLPRAYNEKGGAPIPEQWRHKPSLPEIPIA